MKKIIFIIFIILLNNSCKENLIDDNNTPTNFVVVVPYILPDVIYNDLKDSILGHIDAINSLIITAKSINYTYNSTLGIETSEVSSAFNENGKSIEIKSVYINQNQIYPNPDDYPYIYKNYWENIPYNYGNELTWGFHQGHYFVEDVVSIPNSLGNVTFSSNKLNLNEGGTLKWENKSSNKLFITISYMILDTVDYDIFDFKKTKTISVPDNGEYEFSSTQLLNDLEIPSNATHVFFDLLRTNYQINKYYDGNKNLLNVASVKQSISFMTSNIE